MQNKSLLILYVVFLFWGIIFCMNDILLPYLRNSFVLSYFQASMIQFVFFGAYLIISIPAGKAIARVGYKKGIIIGLTVAGIGCLIFFPAAHFKVYGIFLFALFVLSSGIAMLQAAVNPLVVALGSPAFAASRLNLAQAISKLGYAVAPLIGNFFLFRGTVDATNSDASLVKTPYLILAVIFFLLGAFVYSFSFPKISVANQPFLESLRLLRKHKQLMLGVVGIFMYVGAEITTNAFFINFLSDSSVAGISLSAAAQYLSQYWTFATITGFVGFIVLKYIHPGRLLTICAIISVMLLLVSMMSSGATAVVSMVGLGGFISILFPTIFALALEDLGSMTNQGSAVLLTAVVGGALIPPVQGWISDAFNIRISFIVPCLCYLYIAYYGFWVSMIRRKINHKKTNI